MNNNILTTENIVLNKQFSNQEEAIKFTGNILVEQNYVEPSYVDKMLEREKVTSTFMGNYVAIPHGTEDAKSEVNQTGLSIVTVPEGVDFGEGNEVKILIGIAGKGDEHLEILSKIAIVLSEEENIETILQAKSKDDILAIFEDVK